MKLADDIKPGNYQYYCNLHGPGMSGAIEVVPTAKTVPSQSAVDRAARTQIDKQAKPLIAALKQAQAGKAVVDGKPFKGNLAGYGTDAIQEAFISEFIPNPIKAKVGEKVTWYVNGHTVSFDVPRYFPLATVAKDGKVTFNPRAVKAVNSPVGEFPDFNGNGPPPPPVDVDAGKWDGSGFISSGSPQGAINWSLTFTKAGKYKYACLIHPRMVGEVDVSA
jgi:plastocyanin